MSSETPKNTMFHSSVIDLEQWDLATWWGCAYLHDPSGEGPPALGLMFKDRDAATRIFHDWRKRFGDVDSEDELRVSIIEDTVAGHPSWYHVHINSNLDVLKRRGELSKVEEEGKLYLVTVGRFHKMTPDDLTNLRKLQDEFRKHKKFYLMPMVGQTAQQLVPTEDLAIEKRNVLFRKAAEIGENDQDAIALR